MARTKRRGEEGIKEAQRRVADARNRGSVQVDLSHLFLADLPESLWQLTWLQVLSLDGNELTSLPESIGKLTELRAFYLTGNQLNALPESIGKLTQLRRFPLINNKLRSLPESIGKLAQLQELDLDCNKLRSLPESIGELSQLRYIVLWRNELKSLPDSIGRLTRLQRLDLSLNQLTSLPDSIGKLTQLQLLELSLNQLTSLPDSIGRLTQLHRLDLTDNSLTTLPQSMRKLTSLVELYLHGNDSLGLPPEVLGPHISDVIPRRSETGQSKPAQPADILDYYFRIQAAQRPLNEAKLILVGRGATGKTSIVNRLVHDRFDPDSKMTEGISITEWKTTPHGKEEVRLNIWDFGGQEIMHATHRFFLSKRSLYLVVLNGREGQEDYDADYWLRLVESFGGDSPVIIVLNKIKGNPFSVNRRGYQQKYPAIRDFVETDCEDGTGFGDLRKTIERETDRLEYLRVAFPANWFSIKERLAGMKENFLKFDGFRKICADLGEKDVEEQEKLAGYLHTLGIALNYRDDARLQDTHVLNPHWVTEGVYKIINSEKLKKQNGEIRLSDVSKILDANKYPPYMHGFLFDLMKKFELCFSFSDDETHYLIPELLDKQEPDVAAKCTPDRCLNFEYHYPVLPEGLLPRFIVRSHNLSEGQSRWRTGVVLQWEGNTALVKADSQDRKVFIRVLGAKRSRRRLLAIIRSDFERIHSDFRKLDSQEMVPLPDAPNQVVPYRKLTKMEESEVTVFPELVGDRVVDINVSQLLDGVDLRGERERKATRDEARSPIRIFYSYSHKDEKFRDQLETHLKLMQHQGLIQTWHDRMITVTEDWKREIDDNLERADIILLLVSADFIASEYCYDIEMKRAMERHKTREARLAPIIIRDVNWRKAPFAKLQALPRDGKAVALWPDRDSAWRDVSEGIERLVMELREKR